MGRATARAACADFLASIDPPLPYVGQVYPARTYVEEEAYARAMNGQAVALSANGSAAVLVVNLPKSHRMRRADTGRGAVNDTDIHSIALEIFFASTGGDPVGAQQDHDAVVDAITVAIRGDGTLGQRIWSAGEYRAGVEVVQASPYTDEEGMTVFIPSVIKFEIWEWIAGEGV